MLDEKEAFRRELEYRAREARVAAACTGDQGSNLISEMYARRAAEYERELSRLNEKEDKRRW